MITTIRYMESPKYWVMYAGRDLRDFKVYTNGAKTFSAPQREYESVTIPGRNGDFVRDLGRYAQMSISYDAWIATDFRHNMSGLVNFLGSTRGYNKLEDTYDPDTYRLAVYEGNLDVTAGYEMTIGSFTLSFSARPERWLREGDKAVDFTAGTRVIRNPTSFDANPRIQAYGTGYIETGGNRIAVSSHSYTSTGIVIDCERKQAYAASNGTNLNSAVTCSNRDKWITLAPGINNIVISGFSKVSITPRWWKL